MTQYPESDDLTLDVSDWILTITLARPQKLNAITQEMSATIGRILELADDDPLVRVVLVRAEGRAFCAGADLSKVDDGQRVRARDDWGFAGLVNHTLSKPIVAAAQGPIMGGGLEILLACDLAVLSEDAHLALPEVRRGLIAAAGGAFRLVHQVPFKLAMEMLLTGEAINAEQAAVLGLANRVVPREDLDRTARELAQKIAANAPLAVKHTRRIARASASGNLTEELCWGESRRSSDELLNSSDAREGVSAFLERRAPLWEGA